MQEEIDILIGATSEYIRYMTLKEFETNNHSDLIECYGFLECCCNDLGIDLNDENQYELWDLYDIIEKQVRSDINEICE